MTRAAAPSIPEAHIPSRSREAAVRNYCLEQIGNEGGDFSTILGVALTKGFAQPALLQLELSPKRGKDEHHREQSAPLAARDRRTHEGDQDARIDWMAYQTVGSATHELVVLLDRDRAAPVLSQKDSRPDGEGESHGHDRGADPKRDEALGQHAIEEDPAGHGWRHDEQAGDNDWYAMG